MAGQAIMDQQSDSIAIVGVGCWFPGGDTPETFWTHIRDGVDCTREVPDGRWGVNPGRILDKRPARADRVYATRGGFIDDPRVDTRGLNLEGIDLERLDPVFRLAVEVSRRAWADAPTVGVDRDRVGVVFGNIVLPTETATALTREVHGRVFTDALGIEPMEAGPVDARNAYPAGLPAGLVARALALGGVAYTIDAACASSLYALKLAVDELRSGRADLMLSGGISRPDSLYTQMGFSQLRALSARGRPAPFDRMGDGLVVGEGGGMFVLKRLADASRDGDRIYGVIRGIGLSNDIHGDLLAPSSEGQLRAMRSAYEQAGWVPGDVDLVECHATGTPLGDLVEMESLRALWGSESDEGHGGRTCVLGSAKSNIGHALTAAGAAGLIKVLKAIEHRQLPPTANFVEAAPKLGLSEGGPFRVLTKAEPWMERAASVPRRAAISGFGFGGINAHVLIEEWIGEPSGLGHSAVAGKVERFPVARARELEPIAIVGKAVRVGSLAGASALFEAHEEHRLKALEFAIGEFRIPPRELAEMLPQQLLMLKVAAEALGDSGWKGGEQGLRTAVLVGLGLDLNSTNFHLRWQLAERAAEWSEELGAPADGEAFERWAEALADAAGPALSANRTMGSLGGLVASRISREFRVGGPSFTVSSDETSGVHALSLGVDWLRRGEVDTAIIGAVDLAGDERAVLARQRLLGDRSGPTACCDAAVSLVLRRLDDARRDGQRVYGVIRDVSGGRGPAQTTEPLGYREVPAEAVEAFGAGGRPETGKRVNGERTSCVIDSAEHVTGHGGAAAGLLAIARAVLCLERELLPGSTPWLRNREDGPRRAAVTVRNLGGEEWLVILEGVERAKVGAVAVPERPLGPHRLGLFAIEADDPAGLARRGRELAGFVDRNAGLDIDALARRWWLDGRGRARARLGMAIVADSPLSLKRLLERGAIPETPRERMLARATTGDSTIHLATAGLGQCSRERVAFVYPGLGNYFAGMGRELAALWPEVTRRLDTESRRSRDQLDPGIWWSGRERFDFADHRAPILGQAWVGSFVTDLMRSMGVEPGAAIGYSMGETAALVALRAWTDRDAMFERLRSSRLFISELAGRCNAARRAWGLGPDEAVDWVAGLVPRSVDAVRAAALDEPRVMVLIRNSRDETVIGGHRARVAAVVERLRCAFVEVPTVSTVHCSVATSVAEEYRAFHELETEAPGAVRFYSGVWGRAYEVSRRSASEAIGAQATEMIDYPRVIDQAYADGVRVFLEMGPGGSCTRLIGRILEGRPHLAISACRADVDPLAGVLRVMAEMVANRLPVDLGPLYDFERGEVGQADLTSSAKAAKRLVRIEVGRAKFEVPPVPSKGSAEIVDRGVTRRVAIAIASEPVAACNGQMERGRLDENGPTFETAFESRIEVIMNRSSADQTSADQTSAGELVAELEPVPNGRPEPAGIDAPGLDLLRQLTKAEEAKAEAHRAFLKTSEGYGAVIGRYLEHELSLLSGGQIQAAGLDEQDRPVAVRVPAPVARVTRPVGPSVLDRDKCLEFAVGKMGNVLGAEFAAVDAFPTRVRLPDEPLMLVDRIVEIEGEARSLGSGRVVTEHDILPGAWYLDAERIAPCVAIEAGQADLFLSGYLGIDFETKGLAVYRLLDATVVYHRGLPGPGEMIRYDIRINQFFRQGTTILFRFEFDATVDGEPLLTMRDGCAGFFTAEELAAGRGIVAPAIERRTRPDGGEPKGFALVPFARGAMTELEVDAVRAGELGAGFGAPFDRLPAGEHVLLPGGLMRLIERVAEFSGDGGRFGKGMIRAESAIHADDWFMVCHFVDDRVMPGTLMYECCLQTLRLWMMRAGVVGQRGEVAFEPVVGIKNQLKCRGQIIESTKLVTYEVTIKECGYRPEPYAVADAIIYGDGKALVEVSDMAIQLTGMDRAGLERLWSSAGGVTQASSKPALYDTARITAFAIGKPSDAFGERYRVFDSERFIARLPGPPYQFLDRITAVGGEPWVVAAGAWAEAEFDVEPDHWYFEADRQDRMPFAVLLEAALQPCGWLAAYMGSALTSPDDLKFRNLGGKAVQHRAVTRDSGTLTTRITVTKVASTAGMIIQHFDLSMSDRVGLVYEGETNFGFFQTKALENQVGVRDASPYILTDAERARSLSFPVPLEPPFADERWRMITQVDHFLDQGGPHGLGLVRGSVTVDPSMWFFKAHFMGDPVWPGSLGLESMLQLMKVAAARRWGVRADTAWECPILGREHQWIYRGQIVPRNHRVTVQAEITSRDDQNRVIVADGHLEVDGKVIYQMKSFSLKIVGRST